MIDLLEGITTRTHTTEPKNPYTIEMIDLLEGITTQHLK